MRKLFLSFLLAILVPMTAGAQSEPYAVLSNDNKVLTFYYDDQKTNRKGMDVGPFVSDYVPWYSQRRSIIGVVFDDSFANCTTLSSTAYWFDGLYYLSSIKGISNLKTDNVTNMRYMFSGCSTLRNLDVSGFKTDNVTNMSQMFEGCEKLTRLDVTGFKTDKVTDMSWMFHGCSGLKSLDVSGFKTDKVTNMSMMFYNCSSLTSLDVSGFKTDKVTDMSFMFAGCEGLTSLNVTGFKTDNVTDMKCMFSTCKGLKSLDVSGFKTDKVTDMLCMFSTCTGLTSLDVTGLNTENVTDMGSMFSACFGLTSLDLSGFKTDKVLDMSNMFYSCFNLTTIYAGNGWSTAKVMAGQNMFFYCLKLVGGAGTSYDEGYTDDTYARIDGGSSNPGYFTAKGGGSGTSTTPEAVDLGLPSGTLWANMNVGASVPEDYGNYFAWGETTPQSDNQYDWSSYKWCNGSEYSMTKYCTNTRYGNNGFTDNLTVLLPEDDAATANWGSDWCMPTYAQFAELMYNTTSEWTTQNGVYGRKFTSKTNGNSIFLPAAGYRWDGVLNIAGSDASYWSSTLSGKGPNYARYLGFGSGYVGTSYNVGRSQGYSVRPVRTGTTPEPLVRAVDLDLPSGTLWANMNVGACVPEDYGDYFAWGETTPQSDNQYDWSSYKLCNGSENSMTKYCTNSRYGNNGFTDGKTILDAEDDAATVNWGSDWCMPTKAQFDELIINTTSEWTTQNGVYGRKFTSMTNGNSIFLPDAGTRWGGDIYQNHGDYWSTSLDETDSGCALLLGFSSENVVTGKSDRRGAGLSVRPVRAGTTPEAVDLDLPSGTLWANMNVGASVPEDYGDYFAWGETTPQSDYQYSWTSYKWCNGSENSLTKYCTDSSYGYNGFTDGKTILDAEDDAATANWGSDWCMPTLEQFYELIDNTTSEWTTQNGVYGRKFTSKTNGNSIFLPSAGYRRDDNRGGVDVGWYWSSTLTGSTLRAWFLFFRRVDMSMHGRTNPERYNGYSVRPVRTGTTSNPSSVRALTQEIAALITSNNGIITVSCQAEGQHISVYSVNGQLLGTSIISNGRAIITTQLRPGDIALVKIGSKTVKVLIK